MGKGIASQFTHAEITICKNCFHKDVCDARGYLTENHCCNFVNCEKIIRLPDEPTTTYYRRNIDGIKQEIDYEGYVKHIMAFTFNDGTKAQQRVKIHIDDLGNLSEHARAISGSELFTALTPPSDAGKEETP